MWSVIKPAKSTRVLVRIWPPAAPLSTGPSGITYFLHSMSPVLPAAQTSLNTPSPLHQICCISLAAASWKVPANPPAFLSHTSQRILSHRQYICVSPWMDTGSNRHKSWSVLAALFLCRGGYRKSSVWRLSKLTLHIDRALRPCSAAKFCSSPSLQNPVVPLNKLWPPQGLDLKP